jgi:hypothetical protein
MFRTFGVPMFREIKAQGSIEHAKAIYIFRPNNDEAQHEAKRNTSRRKKQSEQPRDAAKTE